MSYQPRILEKFTSIDGSVSYTFPLANYEWDSSQPLRAGTDSVIGAHYGFDYLGNAPGLKDFATETLRVLDLQATPTAVDTDVDSMLSGMWSCGRGKLYTKDSSSVERWAYARLVSMPSLSWKAGDIFSKTVAWNFRRQSDWFATGLTTDTQD